MQRQSSSTDKESPSKSSDATSDIASPLRKDIEMKTHAGAKTEEERVSFKSEVLSLGTSQVSGSFSSDVMKSPDSLESKDLLEEPLSPDISTDPLEGVSGYKQPENVEATPSTSAFKSLSTSSQYANKSILLPFLADLRTGTLTTEEATQLLRFPYSIPQFETEIESIRCWWEEFYIPRSDSFDDDSATEEPKPPENRWKSLRNMLPSTPNLCKRRRARSSREQRTEIEPESGPEPTDSSQCHSAGEENPLENLKIPSYLYQINAEVRQTLLNSSEAAERIMRYVFLSSPETYLPQIVNYMTEYQSMEQEFMKLRIQCSELLIQIRTEQLCRKGKKTSPDQPEQGQEVTVPFLVEKFELARAFLGQVMKFLTVLQNLSRELNGSTSI